MSVVVYVKSILFSSHSVHCTIMKLLLGFGINTFFLCIFNHKIKLEFPTYAFLYLPSLFFFDNFCKYTLVLFSSSF